MLSEIDLWIDKEDAAPARLEQWLRGGLPIGVIGDEPCVWLLKATQEGCLCVQEALLTASTKILDSSPEKAREDRQEQLLYNLLQLCAGLESAPHLARPLLAMLNREALDSKYNGLDLRNDLRAALARNQEDSKLAEIWRAMLDARDAGFLPGRVRDGFDGIIRMPAAKGDPVSISDLVYGLDRLIPVLEKEYLTAHDERNEELGDWLAQIQSVWGWGDFRELSAAAYEHGWPGWAVEAMKLGNSMSSTHESKGGGRRDSAQNATALPVGLGNIKDTVREVLREAVGEVVFDVLHTPFRSEQGIISAAQHGLMHKEEQYRGSNPEAAAILGVLSEEVKRLLGVLGEAARELFNDIQHNPDSSKQETLRIVQRRLASEEERFRESNPAAAALFGAAQEQIKIFIQ